MKHIKKFNENTNEPMKGFTIGDLKRIIDGLDDETPVLLANPVGRGNNQFDSDSMEIVDVAVSEDGFAYTINYPFSQNSPKVKGLIIYCE